MIQATSSPIEKNQNFQLTGQDLNSSTVVNNQHHQLQTQSHNRPSSQNQKPKSSPAFLMDNILSATSKQASNISGSVEASAETSLVQSDGDTMQASLAQGSQIAPEIEISQSNFVSGQSSVAGKLK